MISLKLISLLSLAIFPLAAIAEPQDFIPPDFIPKAPFPTQAAATIVSRAKTLASKSPYSIQDGNYLSWPPYYWPDCNYCHQSSSDKSPRNYFHEIEKRKKNPTPTTTQQASSTTSCIPHSPIPPTATYTQCAYKPKDGKVNPDVRTLNDSASIVAFSQSAIFNAVAFTINSQRKFADSAVSQIYKFMQSMNQNMMNSQLVRGPGNQKGAFMGLLDARGMVKMVNAVLILRRTDGNIWTDDMNAFVVNWAKKYVDWIQNDELAVKAIKSKNNHGTHMASQLSALYLLLGDEAKARQTLSNFFHGAFMDQLSASGEQPLEAVRTRPFHYRNFNVEALITNAKLADFLGLDFWTLKSTKGATIQTAVDYIMALDPKKEDITELYPHISAVAAAYGDPDKKYADFLAPTDFKSRPFHYYNQPGALKHAPMSEKNKRDVIEDDIDTVQQEEDNVQNEENKIQQDEEDVRDGATEDEDELAEPDSYDEDNSATYDPYGDDDPDSDVPDEPVEVPHTQVDETLKRPAMFEHTDYLLVEDQMYAAWAVVARWYQDSPPENEVPFPQPVYFFQLDPETQKKVKASQG